MDCSTLGFLSITISVHEILQARILEWVVVTAHLLSCVRLFVTPWTATGQASLFFTNSWSLFKLTSIESVMQPNHLTLFSSYPQSFAVLGYFPVSQLFTSGGQSIGASASVLPMNIQGWFSLELTGFISLLSKGFSRVFSKHWNVGSVPGLRRSSKEGNDNLLRYSCLEVPWTEKPGTLQLMGL